MAKEEARLEAEGIGRINEALLALFPSRTIEAIKGVRRASNTRYHHFLDIERRRSPSPEPPRLHNISDDNNQQLASLDSIKAAINLQLILGRAPKGDEQLKTSTDYIDKIFDRAFPAKKKTSTPRRPEIPDDPPNNKQRRRRLYRKTQELLRKNPGRLLDSILEGSLDTRTNIPDTAEDFWTGLLGRNSPEGAPLYQPPPRQLFELLETISEDEVSYILKSKGRGAPGPDGWLWRDIKQIPTDRLASLFNLWLFSGKVPTRTCLGTTTLIPKIPGTNDPAEFRPITVGSVFLRLYHGILGDRFEKTLPISVRQKGFRKGDGLFFNNIILRRAIEDSKKRCKNLRVAFLDMKKAFDSVGHEALWAACRRLGVPEHLVNYCSHFYSRSSTRLVLGGGRLSDPITSKRGIKQGDPLSVHLFNAVIDLCTSKINHNIGYKFPNGELLDFLAFADDLVLLADSKSGLEVNCNTLINELKLAGFEPNPLKSATLGIVARRGKWLCDGSSFLNLGGGLVPAVGINEAYKYLGAPVNARLDSANPSNKLGNWLCLLSKAPLKPQQRLFLLREFLVPKLYHQLILTEPSAKTLRYLDYQVRTSVKKWLKAKTQFPTSFVYAPIRDGGLGIPSFRTSVPRLRHQRLCRLTSYDDPLATLAVNINDLVSPEIAGESITSRTTEESFWRKQLLNTVDGKGFDYHQNIPQAHRWAREPTKLLSGRDFIRVNHLRYNLLMTRQLKHRMNRHASIFCPVCVNVPHTLSHILQSCPRTHGPRVHRHDMLLKFATDTLIKKGWSVVREPHVRTRSGLLKPDLMFWNNSDPCVSVLDVAIVADMVDPDIPHRNKITKYNNEEVREFARTISGKTNVEFGALIVNWRGAIASESATFCRKFITKRDYTIISLRVLQYGVYIYDFWQKSTINLQLASLEEDTQ
jgi:hypothetical protein